MIIGSVLIFQEFIENRPGAIVGFSFMALAGFGTILVGLFPENTVHILHEFGALLPFLIGNIGMIVLALSLDIPKWLRRYTALSGAISLIALARFLMEGYLGLGIGGMERIVAYPQTIWLIVFGIYMSANRYSKLKGRK